MLYDLLSWLKKSSTVMKPGPFFFISQIEMLCARQDEIH